MRRDTSHLPMVGILDTHSVHGRQRRAAAVGTRVPQPSVRSTVVGQRVCRAELPVNSLRARPQVRESARLPLLLAVAAAVPSRVREEKVESKKFC